MKKEKVKLDFEFSPDYLEVFGPIIEAWVTVDDEFKNAMTVRNITNSEPVKCRFLVDTGASGSLVRHEIAEKAGLKLINTNTPVHGIGVDITGRTYFGKIFFKSYPDVWVETSIKSAMLEKNNTIDGIIGRDVLRFFNLSYSGPAGTISLIYKGNH